jgi:alpha-glucoside transport system substrate-binding protein
VVGLALAATGCSGGNDAGNADKDSAECAAYKEYQGHDGTTVTAYSPIRDVEADNHNKAWKQFEDCTGINIEYEGTGEFEAQIQVRVDGGNAPDLAFFPQPGLMQRFAASGKLKAAAAKTKDLATKNYSADWLNYGTINGTFYGAPLGSNVKSYVWYSPSLFKEKNWTVPQTWDQMLALNDQMVASGISAWCAGMESGDATGWPATDWIEDVLLREQGVQVYDQWVKHQIPFNDPRVVSATNRAGNILKNQKYLGADPKRLVTTAFQEGGVPVAQKKCGMHKQGSFYANFFPKGTNIAEGADIFAFYLPPVDPAKGKPVLGGGEFVAAFSDKPEVQAVQTFLASQEFTTQRAKLGNWVSANKTVDPGLFTNPVDKLSVTILQDPNTQFRFDGSDLMPGSVGSGSFWKQMVEWLNGKDTKAALDAIEASWPK